MFEDFLKTKHADEFPQIQDDDLPDHFDDWLGNLSADEFIQFADEYKVYKPKF